MATICRIRGCTAYLVERELILKPEEVENKSNEITAVPKLIETLAVKGVVFTFDAINTQKADATPRRRQAQGNAHQAND